MIDAPSRPLGGARAELRLMLRRIAALVGSRFSGSFLTLLYTLMIARLTTPESFGLVMLGLSWALLISIPLSMNVEGGSVRYLVGYAEANDPARAAGFLRFNRRVLLATGTAGLGLGVLAFGLGWLDPATVEGRVALMAGAAAPVLAATRVYGRHATALDAVLRGSLPSMLIRPLLFCLVLGSMWLADLQISADLVMATFLAAAVITALVQARLLRGVLKGVRSDLPDMARWRDWATTGASLAPLLLMRENLKNVILAAAGLVLSAEDVASLALALSAVAIMIFAVRAVEIAVSPRLSKAIQTGQPGTARRYLGASAALKLAGWALGLGVFILLGENLIAAFGSGYENAEGVMLILLAIPLSNALFGPSDMVLNITGNRRPILFVATGGLVTLVAGTMLGAWIGGPTGAAVGAIMAYATQQLLLCRACIALAGIDPSLRSVAALARGPG